MRIVDQLADEIPLTKKKFEITLKIPQRKKGNKKDCIVSLNLFCFSFILIVRSKKQQNRFFFFRIGGNRTTYTEHRYKLTPKPPKPYQFWVSHDPLEYTKLAVTFNLMISPLS